MQEFDERAYIARGRRRAVIMAIVFVSIALTIGIVGNIYKSQQSAPDLRTRSMRIEYRVTGTTDTVQIDYLNDMAYEDQRQGTPPWQYGFRAPWGRTLRMKVTNLGTGTIGCAITAGDKTLSEQPESVTTSIDCMAVVPTE